MEQATVRIGGMSCGGCVKHVKSALLGLPGVTVEDVQVGSAALSYDPEKTSKNVLSSAISDAGYEVQSFEAASMADAKKDGGSCGCCAK